MLSPDKPKRRVSQAPLKEAPCLGGCGTAVHFRTNPRVYRDDCRLSRTRDRARKTAERIRRARGIVQQKGVAASCKRCGTEIVKRSLAHTFCEPCAIETTRERARRVSRERVGQPGAYVANGQWAKAKRQTSPRHAINFRFRAAIRRVLNGGKKGRKWESLVGYSLADLMAHLERQFLPSMTWDNRGDWEIDHIVPLAAFKFETPECDGFRAAWALTNLRPIWAMDNRRKNAKRTHLL